jgi:flagellar FliL protein
MAEVRVRTLVLSVVGVVIVVGGIAAGVLMFASGGMDDGAAADAEPARAETAAPERAEPKGPPLYKEVEPPILVNFDADTELSYLQVQIELMARAKSVLKRAEQHMPAIRNDLILLLSEQKPDELRSGDGKKRLRGQILDTVRAAMGTSGAADETVEAVYFTKFVMQ